MSKKHQTTWKNVVILMEIDRKNKSDLVYVSKDTEDELITWDQQKFTVVAKWEDVPSHIKVGASVWIDIEKTPHRYVHKTDNLEWKDGKNIATNYENILYIYD